jgi:hypothetical protein
MEFNKEQLEQAWIERFDHEDEYLTLIEGYRNAKQKVLDKAVPDSVEYWQLSIEIFDLDTNIKTKEHYIESMKQDKAQQQAFQDAKMQFIETHSTDILKKARVCIDRGTDRATVLEALTKEMPQRETPEWYARIWEINEHVNAAKVPATEQLKAV